MELVGRGIRPYRANAPPDPAHAGAKIAPAQAGKASPSGRKSGMAWMAFPSVAGRRRIKWPVGAADTARG
jgi:hypothetical protein